jgi:hypothetical protein
VQFYNSNDFSTVWNKLRAEGVTDFAIAPGLNQSSQAHPVQRAPPSSTLPKGPSLLFTVPPLPVGRVFHRIPTPRPLCQHLKGPPRHLPHRLITASLLSRGRLCCVANRSPNPRIFRVSVLNNHVRPASPSRKGQFSAAASDSSIVGPSLLIAFVLASH